MIPPENEEWHVICSSGRDFNFQPKQKQVITNHILHEYHYVLNSSDNNRESSTECFVICFCLYIAITFHDNLTEAKTANELITSVQPLNILSQRLVLFPGLHVWSNFGCFRLSCAVFGFGQSRELKLFCHRC